MMCRAALVALASLLFGCASEVLPDVEAAERPLVLETRFNFTRAYDRGLFLQRDVRYAGAVGDYAAFLVTGPSPRLIGPRVRLLPGAADGSARAMLCGATAYFAEGGVAGTSVGLVLEADGVPIVRSDVPPMEFGGCAQPADAFATRVDLSGKVAQFEETTIVFDGAPEGGTMLVRLVDFQEADGAHNDAHAINGVGCDGAACYLCGAPR